MKTELKTIAFIFMAICTGVLLGNIIWFTHFYYDTTTAFYEENLRVAVIKVDDNLDSNMRKLYHEFAHEIYAYRLSEKEIRQWDSISNKLYKDVPNWTSGLKRTYGRKWNNNELFAFSYAKYKQNNINISYVTDFMKQIEPKESVKFR